MGFSRGPNIVRDTLILALDAGSPRSYPGTGTTWFDVSGNGNNVNLSGPTWNSAGYFAFDGTNDYCVTAGNLDLSSYSYILVEVSIKSNATNTSMFAFEHTANWNTNLGGFGLVLHSNGSGNTANLHHTNHNSQAAKNYSFTVGTGWSIHSNLYSSVTDGTGRLTYSNGSLNAFTTTGGYTTATNTGDGSFTNALFYIGARGGTTTFLNGQIAFLRIYGVKLVATEIAQNYNALKGRFGL